VINDDVFVGSTKHMISSFLRPNVNEVKEERSSELLSSVKGSIDNYKKEL
jgi:hypothetical protein